MERKERVGGERKEKKLIEFLELMTLKGRVTWCLMVCRCPRISPGPVPQQVHIAGLCRRACPMGRSVCPEGNSPSRLHTPPKQPRLRGMACLRWGWGTDKWSFLQIDTCPQSKHWQVNQREVEVPESWLHSGQERCGARHPHQPRVRLTRGKLTIISFPVGVTDGPGLTATALPVTACVTWAMPPASLFLGRLQHLSVTVAQPGPGPFCFPWAVCALVTRHKTPGVAKGPGVIKPLPRGCSRRSQLKVVLTLPAQSRAPAAGLSGPKPHTCTPHPLPSPKSSLTSVPPSEALFSSLPQPRPSTMLFLLLHFLISSQFAPTQLPLPEIPKVSESEVTQSCLSICNPHGL